jgi:hypothetical protein
LTQRQWNKTDVFYPIVIVTKLAKTAFEINRHLDFVTKNFISIDVVVKNLINFTA